jgi:uncharacterized protein (DUF1778 family)
MSTKSEHLQIRLTPREKATLKRLAAAARLDMSSYVLARALPARGRRFTELLTLLREESEPRYVLAELNDFLTKLGPLELPEAVADADLTGVSPFLSNYVAAMVEQACYLEDVPPPAWTTEIASLAEPHFAVPLEGLRPHLLRASPVPFKRRNLFVDSAVGARV